MIAKKIVHLAYFALISTFIFGCTVTTPRNHSELCNKLKRELLYNANNNNVEAGWVTSAQQQKQREMIKQNNCD